MSSRSRPIMRSQRHAILLAIISILLLGQTDAIISVDPGQSIQSIIDASSAGETIEVHGGIYHENVNLTKRLILRGKGDPIIDAGGLGSAITLSSDGSVLEGFTATGSGISANDAGIKVLSRENVVRKNSASSNGNYGFLIYHSSNNTIIRNNASENAKGGILLVSSDSNKILENLVSSNKEGISLRTSRSNIIRANNISKNNIGLNISNRNYSESISANQGNGVSIKYRPAAEAKSYNISQLEFDSSPSSNLLYQNRFIENEFNAYDDGFNEWDSGDEGNYYSDFDAREEGCKDRNRDRICDSGYDIQGGHNIDRLPKASADAILQYKSKGKSGYEMRLYKRVFQPGSEMVIVYNAPKNFSGQIGLRKSNFAMEMENQADPLLTEKLSGESGILKLQAPQENGSYEAYMFEAVSKEEMATLSFQVKVPEIAASPASLATCEQATVSYSGAPGYESDWIGIYKAGSTESSFLSRRYLEGSENGTLIFEVPDAGSYNFRMFENDSYIRLSISNEVQVKDLSGIKVVATPSSVSPGGLVTVTYWGAPPSGEGVMGMYTVTRPDKFWIEMRSLGSKSCGSLTFRVPSDRGNYDFRMFEDNVYRKILGQSNSVTVK